MSKRQLTTPIQPYSHDPLHDTLATIGMKIRKSVMDGYQTGNNYSYNYHNNYVTNNSSFNNYNTDSSFNNNSFNRQPLPISQPPALSSTGSTFESSTSEYHFNTRKRTLDDDVVDKKHVLPPLSFGVLQLDENF